VVLKVPLIIYDPHPEALRGHVENRLVEAIDVVPTILQACGVDAPEHILEGRSLLPLLRGKTPSGWRDAVFAENNYAFRDFVRAVTGNAVDACHMTMLRDHDWKYVHFQGLAPQLFDLRADPDEFIDLGTSPAHGAIRQACQSRLFDWLRARRNHPTVSYPSMQAWTQREEQAGIHIGRW